MIDLRQLHIIYKLVFGTIAIFLNLLVIYLSVYKLSRAMKSYRGMLIMAAFIDTIYSVITMFTLIIVVDSGSKMIFMSDNTFLPSSYSAVVACAILFNIGLYAMIVNVAAQFVYRLNIFVLNRSISMKKFFTITLLYFMWTVAHSLGILINFYGENPETTLELRKNPLFKNGNIPPYTYGDSRELGMFLHFLDVQPIMLTAYSVAIYSAIRIQRKLDASRLHLQASTLEAQNQLSRIMKVQAICPICTLLLPVGFACILPIFRISFDYLPVFITLTTGLFPLCNPLIVLTTIPNYRATILRFFCKRVHPSRSLSSQSGIATLKNLPENGSKTLQSHTTENALA